MRASLQWVLAVVALVGVVGTAVTSAPRRASAQDKIVVLVGDDAVLHRALETALSPWGITVVDAPDTNPGVDVPNGASVASGIASREHAVAVTWVASSEEGHALFVYDAEAGRVVARRVTRAPPFDDVTAASLALSVKTLLRHTAASPPAQRYGAPETVEPTPTAVVEVPEPSSSLVRVATLGGARFFRDGAVSPELRVGLGLTFWPDVIGQRLGVGVELAAGPGLDVSDGGLVARYVEAQLSLVAIARAFVLDAFAVSFVGRLDAVLASLDGRLASTGARVSVFKVDPQAALLLSLDYEIGGARIGLRVGGTALLFRQRYLVAGAPALTLPPFGLEAALFVDFGF